MNDSAGPKYYIGYALEQETRYKASSGGVGTCIQKFLLQTDEFDTSITFVFNPDRCMYEPRIIHDSDEINVCGSIYQDINVYQFVKDNINKIEKGLIVSCPPCQVVAIRQLLDKANVRSFIISFCCSGQTTIEGTWKYYQLQGISNNDVSNLQYRGNGWPSGIQVKLKDGTLKCWDNWTEPWITIHQSGFFRPKRCFFCTFDTSNKSDISLADPWLTEYIASDKEGNSMVIVNTGIGANVMDLLQHNCLIHLSPSDHETYSRAQKNNIEKMARVKSQKIFLKRFSSICDNKLYRKVFSQSQTSMRLHLRIIQIVFYISSTDNFRHLLISFRNRIKILL